MSKNTYKYKQYMVIIATEFMHVATVSLCLQQTLALGYTASFIITTHNIMRDTPTLRSRSIAAKLCTIATSQWLVTM